MKLTTILFDAGGTLVFPNLRRIMDECAAAAAGVGGHWSSVSLSVLARADAEVRHALDRPEIIAATDDDQRFDRYLHALAQAAGLPPIPEVAFAALKRYHQLQNLWEDVPPDVPGALADLRRQFRLGLVSNANGTVRAKLRRLGLAEFFETIVDSREEGVEKPDPRLFAVGLARMNVRPDETAYVGDLYNVDVVGARAAGLRAVLLDPHDLYADLPVTRIRALADLASAAPTARGA